MRRPNLTRAQPGDRNPPVPERINPGRSHAAQVIADDAVVKCPRCLQQSAVGGGTCNSCGFPFICDVESTDRPPQSRLRTEVWRVVLGLAAMMFLMTSGAFFDLSLDDFNGRTLVLVNSVAPDFDSGIEIIGPANFAWRTRLTLGLLKLRAPDYYWRVKDSVTTIEYLAPNYMEGPEGKRISLEGIGAMAHTGSGRVSVLYSTAFPSGPAEIYDRDLFTYAGVLVHELRHIELHTSGLGPGGMEEEVLCERAAYAAMKQLDAPPGLLLRYETYLDNPGHGRYQGWYDWYKQWD